MEVTKLEDLCLERDGLVESIVALETYIDEVYMNKDKESDSFGVYDGGMGVRVVVDKLKDKLKLLEGQLDFLKKMAGVGPIRPRE